MNRNVLSLNYYQMVRNLNAKMQSRAKKVHQIFRKTSRVILTILVRPSCTLNTKQPCPGTSINSDQASNSHLALDGSFHPWIGLPSGKKSD